MIEHSNPRVQREIEDALRSENPAAVTEWEFWAGNELLDDRCESLSYGREGDSQAMALECDLVGRLSPEMRGDEVTIDVIVAGHTTRRFTGRAHRPQNTGFQSTLWANTAGWWATGDNAVKLGRERRFAGYSPKKAAEEQLLRLPYSGGIDVDDTEQQTLERGVTDPFEKVAEVGAVLGVITEETRLEFRDTRLNGVTGFVPASVPIAASAGAVWTFDARRDFNEGDFTYSPEPKEYRDVLAYRATGGPGGGPEDLAYAEIPGSEAPEDATYLIPIETEGPGRFAEARAKANDAITALVNGEVSGVLNLPFIHVLLEEGDVVEVLEVSEEGNFAVLRRWRCRIDLLKDDPFELAQEMQWTGVYLEERVRVEPEVVSSEVEGVIRPPYGRDYLQRAYVPLRWGYLDPSRGFVLITEEAAKDQVSVTLDPARGVVITNAN